MKVKKKHTNLSWVILLFLFITALTGYGTMYFLNRSDKFNRSKKKEEVAEEKEFTTDNLETRAKAAADYLAGMVTESGKFHYVYNPEEDDFEGGYNTVRHAGTSYAMAEVNKIYDNAELEQSLTRAINWLESNIEIENNTAVVVTQDYEVKLGANALTILAILEYIEVTGEQYRLDLVKQMANWIVQSQKDTGEFSIHKLNWFTGEVFDFRSIYYPGEAIFALARLYEVTNNEKWLNSAVKGAQYMRDLFLEDDNIEAAEHDHWLLYGIEVIHRHKKVPELNEIVVEIVKAMSRLQHLSNLEKESWFGGWYSPPTFTAAATRCEGLNAAYKIFKRDDNKELMDLTLETIKCGVHFLDQGYISEEKLRARGYPERAKGGVMQSLTDSTIRIDYVQHAMSCWLGMSEII